MATLKWLPPNQIGQLSARASCLVRGARYRVGPDLFDGVLIEWGASNINGVFHWRRIAAADTLEQGQAIAQEDNDRRRQDAIARRTVAP